jgi:hypothetical protein
MTFSFEITYYPKLLIEVLIFWNLNFEVFKQTHMEQEPKPKS